MKRLSEQNVQCECARAKGSRVFIVFFGGVEVFAGV